MTTSARSGTLAPLLPHRWHHETGEDNEQRREADHLPPRERARVVAQLQLPGAGPDRDGEQRVIAAQHRSGATIHRRSEEHTSELQSRRDLVCSLLLEKK